MMSIEFKDEKELNDFVMKYIEERIEEIVIHYEVDVINIMSDYGWDLKNVSRKDKEDKDLSYDDLAYGYGGYYDDYAYQK